MVSIADHFYYSPGRCQEMSGEQHPCTFINIHLVVFYWVRHLQKSEQVSFENKFISEHLDIKKLHISWGLKLKLHLFPRQKGNFATRLHLGWHFTLCWVRQTFTERVVRTDRKCYQLRWDRSIVLIQHDSSALSVRVCKLRAGIFFTLGYYSVCLPKTRKMS